LDILHFVVVQCIMKTLYPCITYHNRFTQQWTYDYWDLTFVWTLKQTSVEMNSTGILNVLCESLYIYGKKHGIFFCWSYLPFLGSFETTKYLLATITRTRKMGVNNFNMFLIFITISPLWIYGIWLDLMFLSKSIVVLA